MTPFFKVYVNNTEGKELLTIDSFTYEDSASEDSFLNLRMKVPSDMRIEDTPYLKNGVFLYFYFGYLGGSYSQTHKVRIVDVDYDYSDQLKLTLKCLDLGSVLKKTPNQKVWKNKSTIDIALEIMQGYGLELQYDEFKTGTKVWDSIPQGNKSDFDFIKYLVSREQSGNYIFYIRNEIGYIVQRGNEQNSEYTFVYGDGNSGIISFKPSFKESSQTGAGNSTTITQTGADGSVIKKTDNSEPKTDSAWTYDANSKDVTNKVQNKKDVGTKQQKEETKNRLGSVNNPAVADGVEALNLASSRKINENAKILTATLKLHGLPTIEPNKVINMKNVFKPHQGAWLIKKVTHTIDSGYVTTLDLERGYKSNKSSGKIPAKNIKDATEKTTLKYAYDQSGKGVLLDGKNIVRREGGGSGGGW